MTRMQQMELLNTALKQLESIRTLIDVLRNDIAVQEATALNESIRKNEAEQKSRAIKRDTKPEEPTGPFKPADQESAFMPRAWKDQGDGGGN